MRYLSEYIPVIKNQSHNTLTSYRDYYMQYLPFVAKRTGKHADKLLITDLTVERTNAFLNHIETDKGCTIQTRNQRLTAIKSFVHYVYNNAPEYMEWSRLMKGAYCQPCLILPKGRWMRCLMLLTDKQYKAGKIMQCYFSCITLEFEPLKRLF